MDMLKSNLVSGLKKDFTEYKNAFKALWKKIKSEFPDGIKVHWNVLRGGNYFPQNGIVKGYSNDREFKLYVYNIKTEKKSYVSIFGIQKVNKIKIDN